jgi:hypothetical protein
MREAPYSRWIDPVVMLALLSVSPPYPPGSVVTLSDGRTAAVVDWSNLDPCRPTVSVIDPSNPDAPRGPRLDLRKNTKIQIAAIDGRDVLADNFYPQQPNEFDLVRLGKEMSGVKQPVLTNGMPAKPSQPAKAPQAAQPPGKGKVRSS